MAKTTNYNFETPDEGRTIAEEFPIVGQNLELLDQVLKDNALALTNKAPKQHRHSIADIENLENALDSKMSTTNELKFANLADVQGFNLAKLGYVAVKTNKGIEMRSPQAAIGDHKHKIEDIKGFDDKLEELADGIDLRAKNNNWSGTNSFKNNVLFQAPANFYQNPVINNIDKPQFPYLTIAPKQHDQNGGGIAFSPVSDPENSKIELSYMANGGLCIAANNGNDIVTIDKSGFISTKGNGLKWGEPVTGLSSQLGSAGNIHGAIWGERFGYKDNTSKDGNAWAADCIRDFIERECVRDIKCGGYRECKGRKRSPFFSDGTTYNVRFNLAPSIITMIDIGESANNIGVRDLLYRVGNEWRQPWIQE